MRSDYKIGVIGLGYVGLPLALEFSKKYSVVGYDKNVDRTQALLSYHDKNGEFSYSEVKRFIKENVVSSDPESLRVCNVLIIAVPTPITAQNCPDLTILKDACRQVGLIISSGATVVIESTVFPGCSREICLPILESSSGMQCGVDFNLGYSPERVNPGDKLHRLENIVKIVSGFDEQTTDLLANVYGSIISAGIHRCDSLEAAEMAKVVENTQRDLNIALVNEIAKISNKLGLDTNSVLDAACTKWNFLDFRPGLVGGHCIGVDPYYLASRAEELGVHPEVILAGRNVNDQMASHCAAMVKKLSRDKFAHAQTISLLVLGVTFKENCSDFRNSQTIKFIRELESDQFHIHLVDPLVDKENFLHDTGLSVKSDIPKLKFDGVVLTVAHDQFRAFKSEDIAKFTHANSFIFDIKSALPRKLTTQRL